jgi:DNA-binding MarR family transcriptional regulator
MGELSRRMMVTTGNITGITDQLESEGLVRREVDPLDRRSFRVCLTSKGKSVFEQMARVHEGWVIELFSGISPSDKESFFAILGRLKQHLNREEQL